MSRSFKKSCVFKDGSDRSKTKKYSKRQANRKVRKLGLAIRKSKCYRKVYDPWNICDYRFYVEKPTDATKEDVEWWKRWYYRK